MRHTRSAVSGVTLLLPLIVRETVAVETRARFAILPIFIVCQLFTSITYHTGGPKIIQENLRPKKKRPRFDVIRTEAVIFTGKAVRKNSLANRMSQARTRADL